jgi:cytochrome c
MRFHSIAIILVITGGLCMAACSGQVDGLARPRPASDSRLTSGRALLAEYGCGACHTIPGVPGADALAGPPLARYYERQTIAGRLANTEANLIAWIMNPQEIEPGNVMPDLGVSAVEASDMAAYLYHQPTLADWFNK